MELLGFEVEARTPTSADLETAAGGWFATAFGVVPHLTAYVADVDVAVAELTAAGMTAEPLVVDDGDDDPPARSARVTGPTGVTVDVAQTVPSGHYEGRITEFIEAAADLAGPPTDDLAEAILDLVATAWAAIDARLDGVAHNKVLATHLLLSQQSRADAPDSPIYWQRSAASTLLSGFVARGASG